MVTGKKTTRPSFVKSATAGHRYFLYLDPAHDTVDSAEAHNLQEEFLLSVVNTSDLCGQNLVVIDLPSPQIVKLLVLSAYA